MKWNPSDGIEDPEEMQHNETYGSKGSDEHIVDTNEMIYPKINSMEYRKKPVVIEAFMYGIEPIPDWFMDKRTSNDIITYAGTDMRDSSKFIKTEYYCEIKTLEGIMRGNCGDYIIKGIQGEIYPCKPDIFEMTYELASTSSQTEISDEEIMEAIDELNTDGQSPSWEYGFEAGAKWYREQLKTKQ